MRKAKKRASTFSRVLQSIQKYRFLMILSLLFAFFSVVITLYIPILAGRAIDFIVGKEAVDFSAIQSLLVEIAILTVITAVLQWVMSVINNRIAYHTVQDIREQAFSRIQHLPLSLIDVHPHGDIVSRVISDADQFSDGLLLGFSQLFTGIVSIVATLVFMLTINAYITIVVVVLTPISLFVAKFIAKHTYDMFRLQSETLGEETAYINEMIKNQKVVKAFSYENRACEKFGEINDRLKKCSLKAIFYSSTTNPSTRFINAFVYAAVALVGALFAVRGFITVGGLVCFLSYASQYTKPFNEISGVVTEFQNALACAARLFELTDAKAEEPDNPDAISIGTVSGNVKIKDAEFSYTKDRRLIEDLNIEITSGSRVAIVGPSGCGKTTLINLLMRFYELNSGSISIDGVDTKNITRESLRKNFGMVLQDTWLQSGTIRDNIAFGKPDATDEEVIAAAKTAHAHGFIKRLENGYDTVIGDESGKLSEGEKQLLCIARVMLLKPPMLILDEATSSIDTRTELKVQDALTRLMEGRTCFIVAHRLSTVRDADIILVMKDGKIIESGKHTELLKKDGFYKKLYNSQFAG